MTGVQTCALPISYTTNAKFKIRLWQKIKVVLFLQKGKKKERKKVETLYLTKEERDSLDKLGDEFMKEPFKLMDNKAKYDRYNSLVDKVSVLSSKCFYDLGYRFNAPFYWCLIG